MTTVSYREAERSDITTMSRIRAVEWGTEQYWVNRIAGYLDGTINPQKALPLRIIYVAQQGDSIVGFIAGHLTERFDCDGEVEWINVVAEHRGTAAASELFSRLAAWFVEKNALRICVNCAPDNATAIRFYARHGAEPLNRYFLVWNDIRTTFSQASSKERT